uniref:Uncharacterized protein n=1 Tax=Faecalibaculum rodentium TaxID=1702221 RepID=A0A140DUE6_9FIRM|nr:hypothetical protein AALO17_11390 [Faecalibaculum rodentium]
MIICSVPFLLSVYLYSVCLFFNLVIPFRTAVFLFRTRRIPQTVPDFGRTLSSR